VRDFSIDIIIPTFNRPDKAKSLAFFCEKQLGENDRIFIIWQGKDKPSVQESASMRCIYSSPPNLPKARNRGIAEGKADICLFFDDDIEITSPDILEYHRRAHAQNNIGAVAGYVDDPLFDAGNTEPSKFDETTGEIRQNFSIDKSQYATGIMGAHMSFKRRALLDVNGFDENFKGNALWEEVDCAFRIRNSGWSVYYCAEAKVRHVREQSGGCRSRKEKEVRYIYHQFANTAYFCGKHAQRRYYRSWFTFWKYRLEFLTRCKKLRLKHNPWLVTAGIFGACAGIARYLRKAKRRSRLQSFPH
jgi:GT2 family glycosyltransferase